MKLRVDRVEVHQVLYVEDHPVQAQLMRALFAQRPHLQLLVAQSGAHATELAPTLNPSLLLFDQNLPDCLGSELYPLLRLRFGWRDVPAISVTADTDLRIERTGFAEIWHKPIDLEHVLRRLDHWLPPVGDWLPRWEPVTWTQLPARRAY